MDHEFKTRLDEFEARFQAFEARFQAKDKDFENVNSRFDEFDKRFQTLEKRFDDVKWIVGGVTALLGVAMSAFVIVTSWNVNSEKDELRTTEAHLLNEIADEKGRLEKFEDQL